MKMRRSLKLTFYYSFALLYISGFADTLLDTFFHHEGGLGIPLQFWSLRLHSVSSLWFLILFGVIFEDHIRKGLSQIRRKKSGVLFLFSFVILFVTVPLLFYLSNEKARLAVAAFHTYFGLLLVVPLFFHVLKRRKHQKSLTNS